MSAPPTGVQFVWRKGATFSWLSKTLFDYAAAAGLEFKRLSLPGDKRSGFFSIMRYICSPPFEFPHGPWEDVPYRPNKVLRVYEFSDTPWEDDPWVKPGIGNVSWVILKDQTADGSPQRWWGSFNARIEASLAYSGGAIPSKIHHLLMGIDANFLLPSARETAAEFQWLCHRYHQLKELYEILGCDEMFVDESTVERGEHPPHLYQDFRLAREGPQVLIKRMEEKRPIPRLDWCHSRIIINPP